MATVTIDGKFLAAKESALLLDVGDVDVWIPYSVIEELPDEVSKGSMIEIEVQEWFAIQEDLV